MEGHLSSCYGIEAHSRKEYHISFTENQQNINLKAREKVIDFIARPSFLIKHINHRSSSSPNPSHLVSPTHPKTNPTQPTLRHPCIDLPTQPFSLPPSHEKKQRMYEKPSAKEYLQETRGTSKSVRSS